MSAVSSRRLAIPVTVRVLASPDGVPLLVGNATVESVLEEWVVEDGWWTSCPLRRRYFELILVHGRNAVLFQDLARGRWYRQRD